MPQIIYVPKSELTDQPPPATGAPAPVSARTVISVPKSELQDAPTSSPRAPSPAPAPAQKTYVPPPPPQYPGLPKTYAEGAERIQRQEWEDRQRRVRGEELGLKGQELSYEQEQGQARLRKEADAAYEKYKNNPSEENWLEVERAVSVASGKFMPRQPAYKPTKFDQQIRASVGIPSDLAYKDMNPEQQRMYDMALAASYRQEREKVNVGIRHIDALIASTGKGTGSKAEKDYLAYRYKAAKTRLSSIQSDIFALENDKTADIGGDKTAKLADLQGQREQIEKEVDDLQNQVLNPTQSSPDAAKAAAEEHLRKLGITPKP